MEPSGQPRQADIRGQATLDGSYPEEGTGRQKIHFRHEVAR